MVTGKEFFKKVILPVLSIGILLLLFMPICRTDGKIDYFLLWILVGCPFGIRKMFVWLIPHNYGIGESIGIIAVNFIIGGLIGGFVAVYRLIYAAFYTIYTIITLIMKRF